MINNSCSENGNQKATARILLHGRVQGVSFRRFAADCAVKTGVCGYVRNLSDGRSLEALAQGSLSSVHSFFSRLKTGPPGALVEKATLEEIGDSKTYNGFEIR